MCGALVAFQFSKVPQEAIMAKDKKLSEDLSAVAGQTMEQARGAMENYLDFFQKSMSSSPWAGTELNKKVTEFAQRNVDTAFEFAQRGATSGIS